MIVCETCARFVEGTLGDCEVCCNAFARIPRIAEEIAERLKGYEFESFTVGSRLRGSAKTMFELLAAKGVDYDIKKVFNDALADELSKLTGKRRSPNGDVQVVVDLEDFSYELFVKPVYLCGRYLKRVRNVSQTRWLCRACNGKGCELCGYTGRRFATSVEELIAEPVIRLFGAKDAILHGAGREDVDARMLGNGRPFVLEVVEPRRRFLDAKEVEKAINESCGGKAVVRNLRFCGSGDVERVKEERHLKLYRAKIVFSQPVSREKLEEALEKLCGEIRQRTPRRVLHRRSDLLRVRKLHRAELLLCRGSVAVVTFLADAGLYIKELVSGDEGRTKPSLSELLGVEARVEKLDVVAVYG
ncbi:MAG: tRNA pseudouridine(54/55) synthase Pus10 [Archaeoglobaceae archaeon]